MMNEFQPVIIDFVFAKFKEEAEMDNSRDGTKKY